jgi:hypothetical protein
MDMIPLIASINYILPEKFGFHQEIGDFDFRKLGYGN